MGRRIGIRSRLFWIVAAALLPPILLFGYSIYQQRTHIAEESRQFLLTVARGVADEHANTIQLSRTLLALLGKQLSGLSDAPEPCVAQLSEALEWLRHDVPAYTGLLFLGPSGSIACAAGPANLADDFAAHSGFREGLRNADSGATPYVFSTLANQGLVGAVQWLRQPDGQDMGILVGVLNVADLSFPAASGQPPAMVVTIFNSDGRILARVPDEAGLVGRTLREAPLVRAALASGNERFVETPGLDGSERLTFIKRLGHGDTFVAVGHDRDVLFAAANRAALFGALTLLLTSALAFGAAHFVGERLVVRSIDQLADASRRATAGDLSARVRIDGGAEFEGLGRTFNTLIATLEEQKRALEANVAALLNERERAERQASELALTSVRLQGVIDAAPFAIVVPDHDYIVRVWSRGAEKIFGYTADEIVGRRYPLVPEGQWPEFERLFHQVAAGETLRDIEVTRRAKDGRLVDIRFYGVPLRDPDGVIRSNLYTLIDITEEKKNRRKLHEATTDLATLIEAAPVAIELLDSGGRVQLWNPAAEQLFGYLASEAIGHRPPHGLADDDQLERYLNRLRLGERVINASWRQRRKDGRILELQLSAAPITGADGIRGFVLIAVDLTDRNLIERQFHRAQRLESVGQLTGGMAHDFNNLLGIIIGNLELLTDDIDSNHRLRPLVDAAIDACLRGAELNRRLLAFSRQQQLEPQVVDVNRVVEGMSRLLRRTLGEHIEIEVHLGTNVWPTIVDPAQLESAILNLAVNARDAMPDGGRLTVETSNQTLDSTYVSQNPDATLGDYAMIALSDTGTGMPPDVIARAFEPFFTTKEVGQGTGLGLSMVYGFVKQSNGHVKIYSEVGRGTTIRLCLPRAAAPPAEVERTAYSVRRDERNAVVLVVEDNDGLRRVTVQELARLGYDALEADSAAAALALLDGHAKIDLLFSDVVMPGNMDGVALAQEAARRRPGLRILLTSGFTERATRRAEGAAIPWRILSKPYRRQDLARTIGEVMGRGDVEGA